jgi:hypothetical protein
VAAVNLLHPGRAKLLAWLGGAASDPRTDRHLGTCARCATQLEELAPPAADLRVPLSQALQAPNDLVPRLQSGVRKRLDGRQDLRLLGQMLGLPLHTARLLMDEEQE